MGRGRRFGENVPAESTIHVSAVGDQGKGEVLGVVSAGDMIEIMVDTHLEGLTGKTLLQVT